MVGHDILAVGQLSLAAALLVSSTFMPPAQGTMLLMPITGSIQDGTMAAIIAKGASPLARSGRGLIVRGERSRLASLIATHGLLLLSAPDRLCGGARA